MIKTLKNRIKIFFLLLKWKTYIWLPAYFFSSIKKNGREDGVVDIVFFVVDHYEPSKREGEVGIRKVDEWCARHNDIIKKHSDSDGRNPQHTWFYRYDYPNIDAIKILSKYVFAGNGEIEFHLHHGYSTSEKFKETLDNGLNWFNQVGAMYSLDGSAPRFFGYIAGDWALDNGCRNDEFSGVNNEIELLKEAGCYCDFTFPAFGNAAQPRMVNNIYYATDTPEPKSYDKGVDVRVGKLPSGDLMLFQGPLYIDWRHGIIEYSSLESFTPYFKERINAWEKANVTVKEQPNWVFIKLHTHGVQHMESFLSSQLDQMFSDLESKYKKDGYRLHYVSAREAYNLVKAAEAGKTGNPNDYRDFVIGKPVNKQFYCNKVFRVEKGSEDCIEVYIDNDNDNDNDTDTETVLHFRLTEMVKLHADNLEKVTISNESDNKCRKIAIGGKGKVRVEVVKCDGTVLLSEEKSMPYDFIYGMDIV